MMYALTYLFASTIYIGWKTIEFDFKKNKWEKAFPFKEHLINNTSIKIYNNSTNVRIGALH